MGTQGLGALTAKAGCSAVPWKAVGWRKAFLKARLTSEPPGLAGAAATLFSVWKSAQSLCAGQRRDRGAGGSHTSQAGSSGRNRRAPAIALAGGPFPRPALHPSHPHHSPGERPWGLPRRAQQVQPRTQTPRDPAARPCGALRWARQLPLAGPSLASSTHSILVWKSEVSWN